MNFQIMLNKKNLIVKGYYVMWFYLYNSLEMAKLQKWRTDQQLPEVKEGIRGRREQVWPLKGNIRDPCGDRNVPVY